MLTFEEYSVEIQRAIINALDMAYQAGYNQRDKEIQEEQFDTKIDREMSERD